MGPGVVERMHVSRRKAGRQGDIEKEAHANAQAASCEALRVPRAAAIIAAAVAVAAAGAAAFAPVSAALGVWGTSVTVQYLRMLWPSSR
eukprot:1136264-Pelagomonas_calceolata.AAC.2